MDFSFVDGRTLLLIAHIFGVAFGAGGAFISDIMFFTSIRDKSISETEMKFLVVGSYCVFIGLGILILSGAGLFFLNMDRYLTSSKFLAKMTIVAIILINGIFLHKTHMPHLKRHIGAHLPSSDEFIRHRPFLLTSGAVSVISWSFAIILGVFRGIPFPYTNIMAVYGVVLILAILVALLLRNVILPVHKEEI